MRWGSKPKVGCHVIANWDRIFMHEDHGVSQIGGTGHHCACGWTPGLHPSCLRSQCPCPSPPTWHLAFEGLVRLGKLAVEERSRVSTAHRLMMVLGWSDGCCAWLLGGISSVVIQSACWMPLVNSNRSWESSSSWCRDTSN